MNKDNFNGNNHLCRKNPFKALKVNKMLSKYDIIEPVTLYRYEIIFELNTGGQQMMLFEGGWEGALNLQISARWGEDQFFFMFISVV